MATGFVGTDEVRSTSIAGFMENMTELEFEAVQTTTNSSTMEDESSQDLSVTETDEAESPYENSTENTDTGFIGTDEVRSTSIAGFMENMTELEYEAVETTTENSTMEKESSQEPSVTETAEPESPNENSTENMATGFIGTDEVRSTSTAGFMENMTTLEFEAVESTTYNSTTEERSSQKPSVMESTEAESPNESTTESTSTWHVGTDGVRSTTLTGFMDNMTEHEFEAVKTTKDNSTMEKESSQQPSVTETAEPESPNENEAKSTSIAGFMENLTTLDFEVVENTIEKSTQRPSGTEATEAESPYEILTENTSIWYAGTEEVSSTSVASFMENMTTIDSEVVESTRGSSTHDEETTEEPDVSETTESDSTYESTVENMTSGNRDLLDEEVTKETNVYGEDTEENSGKNESLTNTPEITDEATTDIRNTHESTSAAKVASASGKVLPTFLALIIVPLSISALCNI